MSRSFLALSAVVALAWPGAVRAQPHAQKTPRMETGSPASPPAAHPDATTTLQQQPIKPPPAQPPAVPPRRFGRFDLDMPFAQLRALPDLKACSDALAAPAGHADCP